MKRRIFIQHLQQHGCVLIREGGNHSWWGNPAKNKRSSVPRHSEIHDLLARKICKDLDIPKPAKTRWRLAMETFEVGCAPQVVLEATHISALEYVALEDLQLHAVES